jgi:hypothetical protein
MFSAPLGLAKSDARALSSRVSGRSRSRVESSRSLESERSEPRLRSHLIASYRVAKRRLSRVETRTHGSLTLLSPGVGGKKETRSRALSIQQVAVHVLGLCIEFFFSREIAVSYCKGRARASIKASVRLRVVEVNEPKKKRMLCCPFSLRSTVRYLVKRCAPSGHVCICSHKLGCSSGFDVGQEWL